MWVNNTPNTKSAKSTWILQHEILSTDLGASRVNIDDREMDKMVWVVPQHCSPCKWDPVGGFKLPPPVSTIILLCVCKIKIDSQPGQVVRRRWSQVHMFYPN